MSGFLRSKASNYLEWSVEKPFSDKSRKSPTFSYAGNEWYFELKYGYYPSASYSYCYVISLHPVDNTKELDTEVQIKVSVQSVQNIFIQHFQNRCLQKKCDVLSIHFEVKNADTYGEWLVKWFFLTDLPIELHIKENETNHLISNLTTQLPDTASMVMKAKLAANAADDYLCDEDILSSDFGKLLEQQSTSDVTLTCRDRCFSAHRLILAARSEVFSAMFQNKMTESETGKIDITDIDGEVMELILKYVYTGKISDLSVDIASRLYIAADKYSIQSLKNKCLKWMWECLTEENCLEFLLLAVTCNDEMLKDRMVNFVAEILHLLKGDEWQKFSDQYPKLALSVYQKRVFNKPV